MQLPGGIAGAGRSGDALKDWPATDECDREAV